MIYVTKGAFYSCSPLSVYLIGKYSPAFLNTKNACVPKYWYLIVLSLMLSLAYNAILLILYWDTYSFVFVIINMALVLLIETVYGIATKVLNYENVNGKFQRVKFQYGNMFPAFLTKNGDTLMPRTL